MKITVKDVEYVAKLSFLSFEEEDKEKFSQELSAILDYVDKLAELDTTSVKPTAHVLPLKNVFRDDFVVKQDISEAALEIAPDKAGRHFRVLAIPGID